MQNKKIDPKIRFQQGRFKEQLAEARGYKRTSIKRDENNSFDLFAFIGLRNIFSKIIFFIFLLGLFYVLYFPNFLSVKTITIIGLNPDQAQTVKNEVRDYIGENRLKAQQNILTFSKPKVTNYLLTNNNDILAVTSIKKKLWNSLTIAIEPKIDRYLLTTPGQNPYVITNDGKVKTQLTSAPTNTPLTNIKINSQMETQPHETVFSKKQMDFFDIFHAAIVKQLNTNVNSYELNDITSTDITTYTDAGFKIESDMLTPEETAKKIRLVFDNLTQAQQKDIIYIDMRLNTKAYVCLKNTPCANPNQVKSLPEDSSSTTPIIIK